MPEANNKTVFIYAFLRLNSTTPAHAMQANPARLAKLNEALTTRKSYKGYQDYYTKECRDETASGRAGTPVIDLWLFANCAGERFATSKNPDRSDAWEQDVFYREGDVTGQPKFQTVVGNPFMRWAKLCPAEAEEGMRFIQGSFDCFRKALEEVE